MLSHTTYFEKRYMLRIYEVLKRYMFYIIKQVLNEPPGWTRILKVGQGDNKRNHVYMAISFCMCTRRKPTRDLEIEYVSRTVASVYNHMLNGLWLSQLHSGRPMHWHLQVN